MKASVFSLLIIMAMLLVFGACSEDSATDPVNPNPGSSVDDAPDINLFAASQAIAPSFEESAAKDMEWDWGSPMYGLYNKFRVFDPAIHEGVIDASNFFKAIYSMEEELEEMFEFAEAVEATVIEEPFEFGNSELYDHAANVVFSDVEGEWDQSSFAYRIDGETIHFLVAYAYNEDDDKMTMGQLQGSYNPETGDLELGMVYLVDYGHEQYSVRNEISGNTESHEFQLRMATSGSYGLGTSVVGKGVSEGDDAYFLIKMNVMDGMGEEMFARYFVFDSDADEASLQAMDAAGLAYEDLPASVLDYASVVQGMGILGVDDFPESLDEFGGGDISLEF